MMHRSYLILAALLCSPSVAHAKKKDCSNIINQDIGYTVSPNPITLPCLSPLTRGQQYGFQTTLFYNAALEPTIAVNPSNNNYVVVAWQQDCTALNTYFILGENWPAMDAGIGYSQDGGQTWHRTLVPFQKCNGGFTQGVTNMTLAYSSDGSKLYLAAHCENISQDPSTPTQSGITVSISQDNGKTWSIPVFLVTSPFIVSDPTADYSKGASVGNPQITADLTQKKSAYVVWQSYNVTGSTTTTAFSSTTNGGFSWSQSRIIYDPDLDSGTIGSFAVHPTIVSLPNGDLLCFVYRFLNTAPYTSDLACLRSTNHGATWTPHATHIIDLSPVPTLATYTCGSIQGVGLANTQATILSYKVTVNSTDGTLYIVFPYDFGNGLPQIGICVSRDKGITWSAPAQVNKTPSTAANPQAFTASVAVTNKGIVGILYHDFRNNLTSCSSATNTDTWLATYQDLHSNTGGSTGIGLNFVKETRLSPNSYIIENGPNYATGGPTYQDQNPDYATNGCFNSLVTQSNCFYAAHIQSFNGPFTPPLVILESSLTGNLLLDNNRRSAPSFSRINA